MLQNVRNLFPMLLYRGIPRRKLRKIFMSLLFDKPKESISFIKNVRPRAVSNRFANKNTVHKNTLTSTTNTKISRKPTFPVSPYRDYFLKQKGNSRTDGTSFKNNSIDSKNTSTGIRKNHRIGSSIEISAEMRPRTQANKKSKNKSKTFIKENKFLSEGKHNIKQKQTPNLSPNISNRNKPSLYILSDGFNAISKIKTEHCPHINRASINNSVTTESKVEYSEVSPNPDDLKFKTECLNNNESNNVSETEENPVVKSLLESPITKVELNNQNETSRYESPQHFKSDNTSKNECLKEPKQSEIKQNSLSTKKNVDEKIMKTNEEMKEQQKLTSRDTGIMNNFNASVTNVDSNKMKIDNKLPQISYLRKFTSNNSENKPDYLQIDVADEEIKIPKIPKVSSMEYIRREFKRRRFETMNAYTSKISSRLESVNKFPKSTSQIYIKNNFPRRNSLLRQNRSTNLLPVNRKQIELARYNFNSKGQTIPLKCSSSMAHTFTAETDPKVLQNKKKLIQTKKSLDKRYLLSGEIEIKKHKYLPDFRLETNMQMISEDKELKNKDDNMLSNCPENKLTKSTLISKSNHHGCSLTKGFLARHVIDKVNTKLNNLENTERTVLANISEHRYKVNRNVIVPPVIDKDETLPADNQTTKYQYVYNNQDHLPTQAYSGESKIKFNDVRKKSEQDKLKQKHTECEAITKPIYRKKMKPEVKNIKFKLFSANENHYHATYRSTCRCFCSLSEIKTPEKEEHLKRKSTKTISLSPSNHNHTYMKYKITDDVIRSYFHKNSCLYNKTIKVIPNATTELIKSLKQYKENSYCLNRTSKYVNVFKDKISNDKKSHLLDYQNKENRSLVAPERVITRYSIHKCNALKLLHYTCSKDSKECNIIGDPIKRWFQKLCSSGETISEKDLRILRSICIERFGYPNRTKSLSDRYYNAITAQINKNMNTECIRS